VATSGTATFNPDFLEIAEEAFERAGIELRSGYDFRTARRSMNLLALEWANRGIHLWMIEEGTQVLTPGTETYVLPADTIDILEHQLRTNSGVSNQQDTRLERISFAGYAQIPNKLDQGRPVQIFIDRQITPQFTLWPVPDDSETYTVAYWRMRRIQDVGDSGANTIDVPSRFIPALVAGLAYHIAMKLPDPGQRLAMLKAVYDEELQNALDEDRVKTDLKLVPRMYKTR
jgi:hypothetical protein